VQNYTNFRRPDALVSIIQNGLSDLDNCKNGDAVILFHVSFLKFFAFSMGNLLNIALMN
jgi:hypothetical protein